MATTVVKDFHFSTQLLNKLNYSEQRVILVPCHRVVGKNGSLTGYAGGLDVKEGLLALEKRCGG